MTNTKTVLSFGTKFSIYDESMKNHGSDLPVGTYRVSFDPNLGFWLTELDDLVSTDEKVYGNHYERIDRMIRSYKKFDRSLGVLLSGDKGMGKSLMVRLLSESVREKLEIPVILVDKDYPGVSSFLDQWGEALIIFDEFEKVFDMDSDEGNRQNQFLGLFDGISTTKRLYAVTVNQTSQLSDYFINRPGRFHYHLRFDYPTPDEIREYLNDQTTGVDSEEIEKAVRLAQMVNLNYDHLRAVAFELDQGDKFEDIIGDLNIKKTSDTRFLLEVEIEGKEAMTTVDYIDLFDKEEPHTMVTFYDRQSNYVQITFDNRNIVSTSSGLSIDPENVSIHRSSFNAEAQKAFKIKKFSVQLVGSTNMNF